MILEDTNISSNIFTYIYSYSLQHLFHHFVLLCFLCSLSYVPHVSFSTHIHISLTIDDEHFALIIIKQAIRYFMVSIEYILIMCTF